MPEKKHGKGNVISPPSTRREPLLNPAFDSSKTYESRLQRPEWVAIGLLGKVLARDDGTSRVGQFVKSNEEGIATHSSEGYRVIRRTGPNQILVLVK